MLRLICRKQGRNTNKDGATEAENTQNRGAGNHGTALRLMKSERKHEVYIPGKYSKVMSMTTVTKAGKE